MIFLDRMVGARRRDGVERDRAESSGQGAEGAPPPPPSLAAAIAAILDSREEQLALLQQLVQNTAPQGGRQGQNAPDNRVTYADFAAVRPPVFSDAGEPLEADH